MGGAALCYHRVSFACDSGPTDDRSLWAGFQCLSPTINHRSSVGQQSPQRYAGCDSVLRLNRKKGASLCPQFWN